MLPFSFRHGAPLPLPLPSSSALTFWCPRRALPCSLQIQALGAFWEPALLHTGLRHVRSWEHRFAPTCLSQSDELLNKDHRTTTEKAERATSKAEDA
mmetsp:Transcript_78555/g.109148  ORF Transcript_78555/g.109148 Transcript_78555/m.109148 type:complete len:97 (-) Transcript_78555:8-298(-)